MKYTVWINLHNCLPKACQSRSRLSAHREPAECLIDAKANISLKKATACERRACYWFQWCEA